MARYESVVVLKPDLQESQIRDESIKIENLIKNEGGEGIAVENWGKRQIAYLVRKQRHGNYVRFTFVSNKSSTISNVTNTLRITDSVIKFQTHRIGEPSRKFQGNPKRKVPAYGGDEFGDSLDSEY